MRRRRRRAAARRLTDGGGGGDRRQRLRELIAHRRALRGVGGDRDRVLRRAATPGGLIGGFIGGSVFIGAELRRRLLDEVNLGYLRVETDDRGLHERRRGQKRVRRARERRGDGRTIRRRTVTRERRRTVVEQQRVQRRHRGAPGVFPQLEIRKRRRALDRARAGRPRPQRGEAPPERRLARSRAPPRVARQRGNRRDGGGGGRGRALFEFPRGAQLRVEGPYER